MPVRLETILEQMPARERKRVERRTAELIAEEMTLRDLRKARRLTQVKLAKALGISQDGVSRIEQRSDLLLSTLGRALGAMGGKLTLVAEFPDRKPVVISGLVEQKVDRRKLA